MNCLDELLEIQRKLLEKVRPGFNQVREDYLNSLTGFSTTEIDLILAPHLRPYA